MHAHRKNLAIGTREGMSMDAVESILQICRAIRREAETLPDQAPGMNRVAAGLLTAASDYIIAREKPEALERLDDAIRAIRLRTLRELSSSPESRGAHWAGKIAAAEYFRQRGPEMPRGMMPEKTPCGRWYI
ncbi:MAG: hypothetical protein VZR11_14015 [Succinimonas sp.]|nr:hypothetical protein [Succinimonas sp.]